ncbi:MAG: hypothetical protein IPM42_08320 [Saprospiraceae bacterium]|nr:hypothetical protein [Saprospiraceae bacterium]
MNEDQKHKHKSVFTEWLEKLQQESWQLELLISGFAIFGIYASRSGIHELILYSENEVFGEVGAIVDIIIFILQKGWFIFFFNLLAHVILRGLWIGAIGLRYVSQDIDYDSFRYSDRFTDYLKKRVGSYDDFIERLEKICSVIFAYTFLLFLLFTSFMIFIIQILLIATLIQKTSGSFQSQALTGFIIIAYFFLGSVVFFDLITLGGLKRVRENSISKIYFYIYKYFSYATLSFLYRPLLYNFIDHKYTRRLFFLSIPYILIILIGGNFLSNHPIPYIPENTPESISDKFVNDIYYDDLRNRRMDEFPNEERNIQKKRIDIISMEQFEITKPITSFFIRLDNRYNVLLEKEKHITPYYKKGLSFSLFGQDIVNDPEIEKIEKLKSSEIVDLYDKRRLINKEIKSGNRSEDTLKRDSLTLLINSREKYWKNIIEEAKKNKIDEILKAYLSIINVKIDSTELLLNDCYFAKHPNNSERGIRCYINTDSLQVGHHILEFSRKYLTQGDLLRENTIYLPFIKQ